MVLSIVLLPTKHGPKFAAISVLKDFPDRQQTDATFKWSYKRHVYIKLVFLLTFNSQSVEAIGKTREKQCEWHCREQGNFNTPGLV